MSATYCLGDFAKTIRELSPEGWRLALERVPIECPSGCKTDGCYAVCRAYAVDQYRLAKRRAAR